MEAVTKTEETSTCPDCGSTRYDYNGYQVCPVCYERDLMQMDADFGTHDFDNPFHGHFSVPEARTE